MPTIATHLNMMTNFSGPLKAAIRQTNTAISAMENLRRVVERPTHADIDVTLDSSQAMQEARQVNQEVSRRLGTITGEVEIDVTTQVTNAIGRLDGPINRVRSEIDRLADVIQSQNQQSSGNGGSDGGGVILGSGGFIAALAGVLGAGALVNSSVGGAMEQQQLQGTLQAQVGIDDTQAAMMAQQVQGVWAAGWGESLAMVNNDMATVRQNLSGLSQEASKAYTESAYAVQQVAKGQTDIQELSKVTRTLMANFEGLGETQALDLITTGFQRGGDYANDMLDTINEYAVHFAGLGMSPEQMFSTLISASQEGAWNLDKVGDAAKESFIRLQDLSDSSREGLQALGLDANQVAADIAAGGDSANRAYQATLLALGNMDNALDRNTVGVKLFGTQWEDMEDSVILAMAAGQKGLGEFEGATAKAMEALQNNGAFQMEQLKRNFALGFAEAGRGSVEALSPLLTMLNDAFQAGKFQPFFDGLSNVLTFTLELIGLLVENALWLSNTIVENWSGISPIVWGIVAALGAYWLMTQGITLALQVAKLAQIAFNAAMSANPYVLVAMLLIGIVTALITLWNTNDEFAAGFLRAWNGILNFFDQIPIFFTWVGNGIASAFDWAKVETLKIVDSMANGVIDRINWLIEKLKNIVPGLAIDTLGHLELSGNAAVEAEAARQSRAANLESMQQDAAGKAAEREANVQKFLGDRESKRAKEAAEKAAQEAAQKAAEEAAKQAAEAAKNQQLGSVPGSGSSLPSRVTTPQLPTIGVGDKDIGKVGKVGQVDKIKDKVDISSEDLKMLRELAEMKNIQNNVTLQPSISFGDTHVRNESDINTIVAHITEKLEQDIASSVDAAYT
ncbi:phage tail protein [Paenibacillus glucanolyticus]|uniref:Phage tail protein n=1 Tax=Paenibacillus glucanolyticus TaxID=59843 RepID=A0A163HWG2_9BACL|nr:phage tail tape measure protein [Paenibacillus glucanolyticus]KZS45698.1 phage tail protein [Paenibacillus glucanolyticus]